MSINTLACAGSQLLAWNTRFNSSGGGRYSSFELWQQSLAPGSATPLHRHDCDLSLYRVLAITPVPVLDEHGVALPLPW
jgi:hypothetical protein